MTPDDLAAATLVLALCAYAVLGGADFGAGVWELLGGLAGDARERRLLQRAIGPVWEANHVWLIFALVVLMTAFPPAFAALGRALWVPLLLGVTGIVFRGAAYAFRAYARDPAQRAAWERVFALASTLAPLALGCAFGALVSGRLPVDARGELTAAAHGAWLGPTPLFAGVFGVGVCAYVSAVFLVRDARRSGEADLAERWRRRALVAGAVMGVAATTGLLVVALDAPALWEGMWARGWPFVAGSVAGGWLSLGALWARRDLLAAAGAGLAVSGVVAGWAAAQYPLVVPPALTLADARAPDGVLWAMLACTAVGAALLLPSLAYLLWLFKSGEEPAERSGT